MPLFQSKKKAGTGDKKDPKASKEQLKEKKKINPDLFNMKARYPGKAQKKIRRKYLKTLGRYQTTVAQGGTTVAGMAALGERDEAKFLNGVDNALKELILVEEKYMSYQEDTPGVVYNEKRVNHELLWKKGADLEKKLGRAMVEALPRYVNWDGSKINPDDLPKNNKEPLPKCDDPRYELQWW